MRALLACALLLALLLALLSCSGVPQRASGGGGPGFRSPSLEQEHYRKHGAEFGNISQGEYLRRAQILRDTPPGNGVLEYDRADGVATKFDRHSGAFGAYEADGTIRTFFIPNDGERYFYRQARHYDRR